MWRPSGWPLMPSRLFSHLHLLVAAQAGLEFVCVFGHDAIVKPTALGPVANTDTKLLIYGLFQKATTIGGFRSQPERCNNAACWRESRKTCSPSERSSARDARSPPAGSRSLGATTMWRPSGWPLMPSRLFSHLHLLVAAQAGLEFVCVFGHDAIVKPTALGPVANTDTKLLIYGLFQSLWRAEFWHRTGCLS